MKYIICFLIYFSSFNCFSQIKIELTKSTENNKDYIFKKTSDSTYLNVGHKEDMGAWYGFYFEFKKNIPDGNYQVFVNNKIRSNGLIKNSQKEGFWKEYNNDGELTVIYKFNKGILNGKSIWNYRNKKVKQIANYKKGKVIWSKSYNEEGKLISKTYFYE